MSKRSIRRGALMWIPYEAPPPNIPWRFWGTFAFRHPLDITRFPMGDKRRPGRIRSRG